MPRMCALSCAAECNQVSSHMQCTAATVEPQEACQSKQRTQEDLTKEVVKVIRKGLNETSVQLQRRPSREERLVVAAKTEALLIPGACKHASLSESCCSAVGVALAAA